MTEKFAISAQAARTGQMIFLICYAFGCELWAPWSEELGRRWTLQASLFLVNSMLNPPNCLRPKLTSFSMADPRCFGTQLRLGHCRSCSRWSVICWWIRHPRYGRRSLRPKRAAIRRRIHRLQFSLWISHWTARWTIHPSEPQLVSRSRSLSCF